MAEDLKENIKDEAAKFFSTIKTFEYCKVAELKTVCVRSELSDNLQLGEWVCIGLVGLFKTDLSPSQRTPIFENDDIFIEKQAVNIQSLRDIIDDLIKTEFIDTKVGRIMFGGLNVRQIHLRFNERAGYYHYLDERFSSVALEGWARVEGRAL